jgi:hypothetical protein
MTLDIYAHLLPGAEKQVLDSPEAKGLQMSQTLSQMSGVLAAFQQRRVG